METSDSIFDCISLFPLISRLLSVKYKRISYLISFFYLIVIAKSKIKSIAIKAVTSEYFEALIFQNIYKTDFVGDIHNCALLSINTLVALSTRNKSWLKITKIRSDPQQLVQKRNGENFLLQIEMPVVGKAHDKSNYDASSYYIQCVCVSSLPEDFKLYVTDIKLFNISKHLYKSDTKVYSDLINKVGVEIIEFSICPKIAESAVVSGILCENNISNDDFENILNEYFLEPRCLKAGEIFYVNLNKYKSQLKRQLTLCTVQDVYYKVLSINGKSDLEEYYIIKGHTSLYLSLPVRSYIPKREVQYVNSHVPNIGFESSFCPTGLLKYFEKLKLIFKPFLNQNDFDPRPMFLLSGPEGSGKKTVVQSVAHYYGFHLLCANGFDFYGNSISIVQGKLDQVFCEVKKLSPCIIYIENVEFIGREQNHMENARLIDIFETHVKEFWIRKPDSFPVIIICSTHKNPSELLPAIARLFVATITFESPSFTETYQTLNWLCINLNMICSKSVLKEVAERIKGFVLADLALLVQYAIRFHIEEKKINERVLLLKHFERGIDIMEAAYSDTIGAARVPSVQWEDIGGLEDLKEEIMLTLNLPLKHPELFNSGLKRSGILFYGPPGTGKTLMAKAVATECNYNFLSIKGPELLNMYVGQSEKNVREVFERAREASPCIIFFDELDSLAPSRGKSIESGSVTDRVVSQLLTEMDGVDKNKNVFVIAATNRPDLVDQALLRPGRFDKMFYVGVCHDENSKLSVFKALTRRFSLGQDVDFNIVMKDLPEHVTGADIYSICSNAWFSAARKAINKIEEGEEISPPLVVNLEDFIEALKQFVPSLAEEDIKYYESIRNESL